MDSLRRGIVVFTTLMAWLVLTARLEAFVEPGHEHDLPNLDKRRLAEPKPKALPPGKAAAAEKLKRRVHGVKVERDDLLDTPKYISSTTGFLSGPNGEGKGISPQIARGQAQNDRHRAIKSFLNEHAPLFGHGAEALNAARLKRDVVTKHNGLRTVVWEQRLDEIAVYEGVLVGNISSQGELVNLSSQFIAEPARAAEVGTPNRAALQTAPPISAAQAILIAAENIEEELTLAAITPLNPKPEGNEKQQTFKAGQLPGEARARLIWLPMDASSLRLCWEVELTRRAHGERFRVLIDVQSGEVHLRQRLTVYLSDATFRVFTSDSPAPFSPGWPTPNSNQPPFAARSLVTLSALNTNASPIGWISDGENETRGNNVDAHADRNGDDIADLPRPQGSPFRVFDPPLDLSQAPTTYTDAATVQLFYWCNWMHDRLYELGFDEASGNFQKDNFGRGGVGTDAIQADAQDGSGFNNANFTPTPDGVPGRIQMFIWNGPNPDIDGDLDAEVVLHEYAHGLSTRLVGGGVGIGTLQAAGMGEGWSDFYALSLLSEPGDDPDGVYPFGAYASTQVNGLAENYYFGIRRYPYSTDLSKNPLTFKDIDASQASPHTGVPISPLFGFNPLNAPEVHSQGEVWCAMLWEGRANLIRRHGYSAGNQLMLQLVTDGMKLSPPNPTFTQARDAILLADQVNNQGANYGDLWAGFAKRGLGFGAVTVDTSTTFGILEAYDLPDSLFVSNPVGFVSGGPPGGPFTPACQIYPLTNISDRPLSWTARVTQPWLTLAPATGTLAPGTATNVTVCVNSQALEFPLGTFSDTITFSNTVTKVSQTRSAEVRVVTFTSMPFIEDFESGQIEPHWSVTGTATSVAQVSSLYEPHGGSHHLTLDCLGGLKARNEFTLGIDLGGYTNVLLKFWAKSFGDEPDGPPPSPFLVGADFDGVAISEDGVVWYEVQELRSVPATYAEYTVDLDAAIAAHGLRYNETFRIRFNQVDDFQIPFDGLSIDDISITGVGARRLAVTVPERAVEGSGLLVGQGEVRVGAPTAAPVLVTLDSSDPSKVTVPPTLTIPAGSDRATFGLTVLDNVVLDGSVLVTIRASAADYFGDGDTIEITDDEQAELRVNLPPKAREGDGRMVKQGIVRLNERPARDVAVQLFSSDPAELKVPASVILPAGEKSIGFDLTVVDDDRIDGTRSVTITAHVEHWLDGSDTMSILDNDAPALFVLLPASASEGNGVLTNEGKVRLSGSLPTNLVAALRSSDLTELRVPPSVLIPAGQLEAPFNLTPMDDALVDGRQTVTVTAETPGFARGSAAMTIFDDETPATPLQPYPADRATNVPVAVTLSWNPGIGEVLVNGGFETGDFAGWLTENSGYGAWIVNDGNFDPDGPDGTNAPLSGKFSAMTAQIGGGRHLLYQDVFIPLDALGATLVWSDRIRNHTPYFAANQVFRVEVRDTSNRVLAEAFTTKPEDPLIRDWTQRSFDISRFRGQTVRIAFHEEDSTGYFNVHLDDVSVRLTAPETPTTFDVYFGTSPTPGPAEFRGNSTNAFWALPPLPLNTKHYWQVAAKRGAAVTRGPIWQFTTRGVGLVNHFEWGRIASPQFVGQRFPVTLTARDDINNVVKSFAGPVMVTGLPGSGTGSSVAITEIDVGPNDRTEFVNVSGGPIDLSGWQMTVYDSASWPAPLTTVLVPSGTLCPAGGVFRLNDSGEAPGGFPNFNAGTNVNWNIGAIGNPIAVLLRDAGGNVVDFVAAGNADPALITQPMAIAPEEWMGPAVLAALPLTTLTLQRSGDADHNHGSDWTMATGTFGTLNPGLAIPFPLPPTIALTPTVLTNFVTGIWAGFLKVQEAAPRLTLRADDGEEHFGVANEFAVGTVNDIAVSVADSPDVVILGDNLSYRVTITNSGPNKATGVVLTNHLPAEVNFLSAATFHGVCSNAGSLVVCQMNNLSAGDSAKVTITTHAISSGVITNLAGVTRAEPDGYLQNNRALAVTTVTGPFLSTTNVTLTEGNNMTNARVPVRLSAPCTLPVSVKYATSNFTAIAGADYAATEGTLVFAPGVTNLTIDVPIVGDLLDELIENFLVILSSPSNGVIIVAEARCRINDDDAFPSLFINDVTLTEGPPGTTNYAMFNVRLSAPSGLNVGATFTTSDRTAAAPTDYLTTFGTLGFPSGETNRTITVAVRGDRLFETAETFAVTLSSPFGALLGRSLGIATIQDDDDGELDHFVWGVVPSPQYVNLPFMATLTARDGLDRIAAGFDGMVALRGVAESRELTIGTGTNAWENPLGTFYHDGRTQVIYLPEELGGPGKLNALALQVASAPGQTLSNWTIRLKHTSMTGYVHAAWESDGWITVYQNDETVMTAGWATFLFGIPFDYDGTNSLLVDLSFNNATYSVNGLSRSTVTAQPRSVFFQTDSAFGDPLNWSGTAAPPPLMLDRIPNARFTFESPVELDPAGPIQLTAGVWTGAVTVKQAGTNIFLRASDHAGHLANGNLFAVESEADADGDGLPDAWERRSFGSTSATPNADADADGVSNLEEFRAGTDPVNAGSVTLIRTVAMRGADVVIRFGSVMGKAYRLERTRDLAKPEWTAVGENLFGTGTIIEATDVGASSGGSSFYRVRVIP